MTGQVLFFLGFTLLLYGFFALFTYDLATGKSVLTPSFLVSRNNMPYQAAALLHAASMFVYDIPTPGDIAYQRMITVKILSVIPLALTYRHWGESIGLWRLMPPITVSDPYAAFNNTSVATNLVAMKLGARLVRIASYLAFASLGFAPPDIWYSYSVYRVACATATATTIYDAGLSLYDTATSLTLPVDDHLVVNLQPIAHDSKTLTLGIPIEYSEFIDLFFRRTNTITRMCGFEEHLLLHHEPIDEQRFPTEAARHDEAMIRVRAFLLQSFMREERAARLARIFALQEVSRMSIDEAKRLLADIEVLEMDLDIASSTPPVHEEL